MTSTLKVSPEAALHYSVDDPAGSGKRAGTVLMVHGFGESSEAWRDWVSHFTQNYRVARYDQRGFGRSSPMPEDFAWSLDLLAADMARMIETVSDGPVHVVAAKIAGSVSIRAAVKRPDLFKSLTLVGAPVKGPQADHWIRQIKSDGMLAWAKTTMDARMGPDMPADQKQWWIDLTAATAVSTAVGFLGVAPQIDVTGDLPKLACPCLVISTDSKRHPLAEVESWRPKIPRSEIVVVPGEAYHAAASAPDFCAEAMLKFIRRVDGMA